MNDKSKSDFSHLHSSFTMTKEILWQSDTLLCSVERVKKEKWKDSRLLNKNSLSQWFQIQNSNSESTEFITQTSLSPLSLLSKLTISVMCSFVIMNCTVKSNHWIWASSKRQLIMSTFKNNNYF